MIPAVKDFWDGAARVLAAMTTRAFQKSLTSFSTYLLVVALVLIVWRGPWAASLQERQIDILGLALLGALSVWGICTLHTRNAVRDMTFKAGQVEATVDFNESSDK